MEVVLVAAQWACEPSPFHDIGGVFYHHSLAYEIPGPDPARRDYRSFARFSDPDGNGCVLAEVRAPGDSMLGM